MTNFVDGASGNSDLIFSAFDNVSGVGYTFDLGVALNTILGADNSAAGSAIQANSTLDAAYTNGVIYDGALSGFTQFLTDVSTGGSGASNVEWNLAAADSSGRARVLMSQGDTAASVSMNNSKVAYVANSYLNYMDAVTGKVGSTVNVAETTVSDNAAYAGGSTWGSTGGVSGVVDNTNLLVDGAIANLYLLSQTNSVTSQATTAYTAQIKDANGTPLIAKVYQDAGDWKLKIEAVVVDAIAPTVSSVAYGANDGTLAVGESINFVVNFSENVNVAGGTPTLTLDNGATATYVSGTGTGALTFSYTPAAGDTNSADLSVTAFNLGTATVKDVAGNNADISAAISNPTGTVAVDAVAPTVNTFSPADEAVNVAGNANIVVTFSEAIAKGAGNIVITNAAGATIETFDVASSSNITVSGSTLTINPTNDLANAGTYNVSFAAGSIKDLAGNNYAGSASYNFTTTTFQNGGNGDSDLVFSAWDNTAGVGYTFDLGLSLNKLLGADNSGAGAAVAANTTLDALYTNGSVEISLSGLSSFLNNPSLASVEWNLAAADSAGRARVLISQGDSSVSMAMNNSKVATTANNYNNYLDAVGALNGQGVNPVLSVTADNAAYAGGATWSNSAGVSGGLDNSNLLTQGASANLILLAQTNSATSQSTTAYTTQVTDANGNPLTAKVFQDANGEWKLLLTTLVDTVAPSATSFLPNDDETNVHADSDITIGFNETIKLGTGNIIIKDALGNVFASYDVTNSSNVSVKGYVLTINPSTNLADFTSYSVELGAGTVQDIYGNPISAITTYNFKTSDPVAPTVLSFSPADESTAVAVDANITVTFSETVTLGTGNILLKDGGGNVIATYDVATSSNLAVNGSVLTINPSDDLAGLTSYSVEFAAGTVTDLAGNSYAGTSTYNFTTAADLVAPSVLTFAPADDVTDVAINSNIVLTFSEAIVRGTGNIVIKDGATVIATYDAATSTNLTVSGDTLTINPTADLSYGVDYTVEFAAGTIKDVNGNGFAGTTTYNFTTETDFDAPVITTFSPADEATGVTLAANIVVTFNEAVKFGTGNIVLKDANGDVVETFDVGATGSKVAINGAVLTINPTDNFKPLTGYTIEFDTGAIQDLNGNSLDGNTYEGDAAYSFTTLNNKVSGATAGNDKLFGTANDDLLDGLAGKDTMVGKEGNDTYVVDNAKDVVTETKDGGTADLIITKVTLPVLSKYVENLTLDGTLAAKLRGTGNELDNTITGDDSHNLLNGKSGNDTVFGGLGNDTILGDTGNDSLDGGAGNDAIDGGKGLDILFGGEGRDILLGGTENDYLDGGTQGDKLDGGAGNDTLIGNAGNDTLKGGVGSDIFQFGDDSGFDMISDFTYTAAKGKVAAVEDIIQITGHKGLDNVFDANDFTVSEGFDAVVITFNDKGGQILLKGITDPAKVYFNDTNDTFTLHNDPLTNVSAGTND